MIFEIFTLPTMTIFVEVKQGEAWRAFDLLPPYTARLGSAGGYENCLVFFT